MSTTEALLPYAIPAPRPGARAWAGAAIIFGGLGLVGLGGCFLIGVLSLVTPAPFASMAAQSSLTSAQLLLMSTLYVLAFACFAGAAALLFIGTRALLRVMNA
jgi:hypothetical protein